MIAPCLNSHTCLVHSMALRMVRRFTDGPAVGSTVRPEIESVENAMTPKEREPMFDRHDDSLIDKDL